MYRLEYLRQNSKPRKLDMPCKSCGPGYASPAEAIKGPREEVLFVTCPHANGGRDMVAAVDVNPKSSNYCQLISRVDFPNKQDEVHHSGWNACSSCFDNPSAKRTHMIFPCLNSSRIYVVNVENKHNLFLHKTIEPSELEKFDVSFPHTSHCLADGSIMISTLGDKDNKMRGNFLLLDGKTYEPTGVWPVDKPTIPFNYDFWYQPRRDVMISTEWGSPHVIKKGFDPEHVPDGLYGRSVHVFQWSTRKHLQTIELDLLPLEIRWKHDPNSPYAFCGTALGSSIWMLKPESEVLVSFYYNLFNQGQSPLFSQMSCFYPTEAHDGLHEMAGDASEIRPGEGKGSELQVEGWTQGMMPSLITDILISMDDRFLFVSNWFHGDIRQYDISDPENIKLISQIFVGGLVHKETEVKVINDEELTRQPAARYIQGKRMEGGPQMLQLSLDGKRLYVTNSLYRQWDRQFYPGLDKGGFIIQVDVSESGMVLNENFLVDLGDLEGGPYLAHEMRYPGGDCTSDIWI